ncbi:MAG: excinuclease ABC subunit A [bacterium]|nr:excinuclease ABC subunit A [bacterium]
MNRLLIAIAVGLTTATVANSTSARNTFHELDVNAATSSSIGNERLLDVPIYMAGQHHPTVIKDLGVFRSNRRTSAFAKSDENACNVAFLSAVISLQRRAQSLGGDAVVDIKSITRNRDLESATQFRCVAGAFIANVALSGRVVKVQK